MPASAADWSQHANVTMAPKTKSSHHGCRNSSLVMGQSPFVSAQSVPSPSRPRGESDVRSADYRQGGAKYPRDITRGGTERPRRAEKLSSRDATHLTGGSNSAGASGVDPRVLSVAGAAGRQPARRRRATPIVVNQVDSRPRRNTASRLDQIKADAKRGASSRIRPAGAAA